MHLNIEGRAAAVTTATLATHGLCSDRSATVLIMIADEAASEAARRLARTASSPARVILFGSRARGDGSTSSDLDFLVIEQEVASRRAEGVRLRRALSGLELPVDVIVVTEEHVEEWGDVKGTVLYEALREGRLLAQS